MKKNLFIFRKLVLTSVFLLTIGSMMSCGRSSEITAIAANQSNEVNKKLMDTPTPSNVNYNDEIEPTDSSKIPTVTYCDLIKNAAGYDRKIVRVRAIYFNAFERSYLYDERCEIDQPPTAPEIVPAETWAEWDKSLVTKGDSDQAKLNLQLNGFGRKDVTVIGRFNSTNAQGDANAPNLFGHMNCCRFQFQIMRLEKLVAQAGDSDGQNKEMVKSSVGSLASPNEAYKTAFIARQKKDIEGLKRVLSRKLIKFLTDTGKAEKKTLDDQLKELTKRPQAQIALTRDEKIYDDEAKLEYLDENGKWIEMCFVKENGEWKLTLPGEQLPVIEKMINNKE
jgi:hypothetical protein